MTANAAGASVLRGDEGALYDRHHAVLWRRVRRYIHGPDALIDDACQQAWLILLRRQPDRETVLQWLTTVAIREAYRLSNAERRELSLDDHLGPAAEGSCDSDQAHEARRALRALAELPDRQRRYVALLVSGYSYREISEVCGVTMTNVNKHIYRGHRTLKRAQIPV